VPVVLVVGIIAILVGVFAVATGRGGELAYEHADHAPLDLGPVSATDVALLRPPTALWGYNMQVTDEALDRIARALRDRDIQIASLQPQPGQSVADTVADQPAWFADSDRPSRQFVPKHERPSPGASTGGRPALEAEHAAQAEHAGQAEQVPGQPATTEHGESPVSESGNDDDATAAAEEQGW
jgi:hypothetical protein